MKRQPLSERLRQTIPSGVKTALRPAVWHARRLRVDLRRRLPGARQVPSFLLVGAMKAGTTSLFNYLAGHPDVRAPVNKEIDFFSYNWLRGDDWYRAHFPHAGSGAMTGEASSGYLWHPRAPDRIRATIPSARIVVLLRDPVRRAISHYHHECRAGRESRPIETAMTAPEADATHAMTPAEDLDWYRGFQANRPASARALVARYPIHRAYLAFSRYADQLQRWLHAFDRSELLILRSEDLFADVAGTLARVCQFVGLPPPPATAPHVFNPGVPRKVVASVEGLIGERLASDSARLPGLIGESFRW